MAKSELVYEFEGSRNLNTTPIDITGLQGDLYDYEVVIFFEVEGVNSSLEMTFNNDSTSNYRRYDMTGDGSSSSAFISDSQNNIILQGNSFSFPSLGVYHISGVSSSERCVSGSVCFSASSNDVRIRNRTGYWKDTSSEITSMQLSKSSSITSDCHILLYRVPKTTSQGNWEKIDTLTWNSEGAEKSFIGLDGDVDEKYRILYNLNQELSVQINSDSSSSYIRQGLQNSSASISSNKSTETSILTDGIDGFIDIDALTGAKRLITSSASNIVAAQQSYRSIWYSDTSTNITTIDCTPSSSATGTATLYRAKNKINGTLPWELIDMVDISGNFSAGNVTNIEGDKWKLIRIEFLGDSAAELRVRLNGDTSANYTRQFLRCINSSIVSASATETYMQLATGVDAGEVKYGNMYLYPKSVGVRPALSRKSSDEDEIRFDAHWWGDISNEIVSITSYGSSTATTNGKLKISGMR